MDLARLEADLKQKDHEIANLERRLRLLSIHYENALRYGMRLEVALRYLQKVVDECGSEKIRQALTAALNTPKPPDPLANFYKDGYHTGHPYPEYLHLPGVEYTDPQEGGNTTP